MNNTIIINETKFNFYGFFIVLSLILSLIYVYFFLRKEKVEKKIIFLSMIMSIPFIILGGNI